MCGIAALITNDRHGLNPDVIDKMTDIVSHRGPDGRGTTLLVATGSELREVSAGQHWNVALGHRRLSIIDLSDAGRQPMPYGDRLWLVFNGEIYNYLELRSELEQLGHPFRSKTDTEVILAAYQEWGTDCFQRFRGMWGLVLIDGRRQVAIISRDRLGIKPVYLARSSRAWAIVSEIKQLRALPGFALKPNQPVLSDYLRTGYEQDLQTFYEGVAPLPPGVWQAIDLATLELSEPRSYWRPEQIEQTVDNYDEAARAFRQVFEESVRIHLRSDVPVGCALSGGLDSSAVAGCIRNLDRTSSQFHTFSVVFPGTAIDETPFVQQVMSSVDSQAHYVTPTVEEFVNDCDRWLWIHDEPVGSLSQYAGYALARLTRDAGVPVTLNGQGGDEILGGYWQSYFLYLRNLFRKGRVLAAASHMAGALAPGGNPQLTYQAPAMWRRYKLRRRAANNNESTDVIRLQSAESAVGRLAQVMQMTETERRLYEIRSLYLPRLLKWDDRNFMAFAVEGRYPFLDHEVIETALSFSSNVLFSRGWTKEPLRRGMQGLLPQAILRRRSKWGFETPQGTWLRGPLRPQFERWLGECNPVWQFIERDSVGLLAQTVWSGAAAREEPAQALFRAWLADRWLRTLTHSLAA